MSDEQGAAIESVKYPDLHSVINEVVHSTTVVDIHTHLFAPEFGSLNLSGIDELLTYHYLIAELFRCVRLESGFWKLSQSEKADIVWRELFINNTPISEATRGVVTVLDALSIDPGEPLSEIRRAFDEYSTEERINLAFKLAGVESVVMTNDPFDPNEDVIWKNGAEYDSRFKPALRLDGLLNNSPSACSLLNDRGLKVSEGLDTESLAPIKDFFSEWIGRMSPLYLAVSLPDDFAYPVSDDRTRLIDEVVLPLCREYRVPFALMIGVRRGVNPMLFQAGDGVGRADVSTVERLCRENPDIDFLVTFLSRENQHELCVAARKFSNLMPFGCWWFLNNPSIIAEITTERLELLGTSFIPQHSDARVLEQLIYKWRHSRKVIAECLTTAYAQLSNSGRRITRADIDRDVKKLFSGNFLDLVNHSRASLGDI